MFSFGRTFPALTAGTAGPVSRPGPSGFDPGRKGQLWTPEERRLLIAMRRHRIKRKVIARVLLRTPAAVKRQIELMR
jgi:hypothetical protein